MIIAITLLFVFKLVSAIFAEGVLAMVCLWPINDQPTSKGQFIFYAIFSLIFLGWLFNWYQLTLSIT